MQLHHEADLDAPLDHVWRRALDPEVVAGSFPGGRITSTDGDSFTGAVSVGVGFVRLTYAGQGRYAEIDESAHRAVVVASGGQTRGPGRADIRITLTLAALGEQRTHAVLDTDLIVGGSSIPVAGPLGERIAAPLVATFLRRLAAG